MWIKNEISSSKYGCKNKTTFSCELFCNNIHYNRWSDGYPTFIFYILRCLLLLFSPQQKPCEVDWAKRSDYPMIPPTSMPKEGLELIVPQFLDQHLITTQNCLFDLGWLLQFVVCWEFLLGLAYAEPFAYRPIASEKLTWFLFTPWRILYGRMKNKTGSKTQGKSAAGTRMAIVLRFLAGSLSEEIRVFLDLLFEPVRHFNNGMFCTGKKSFGKYCIMELSTSLKGLKLVEINITQNHMGSVSTVNIAHWRLSMAGSFRMLNIYGKIIIFYFYACIIALAHCYCCFVLPGIFQDWDGLKCIKKLIRWRSGKWSIGWHAWVLNIESRTWHFPSDWWPGSCS